MTYFNKNAELKNGYNAYIDTAVDDMGTQMDIGLLLMEKGDTFTFEEAEKEIAVLLFAGSVTYEWNGKTCEADRPDCFPGHQGHADRPRPQRALYPEDHQRKGLRGCHVHAGDRPDPARRLQRRAAGLHGAGDQDFLRP